MYRDDLKSRLDSKSPLAQYVGSLYDASAGFMLVNPTTVQIILRFVARVCRQLSQCESVIDSSAGARSNTSSVREAKLRFLDTQQELEKACQLLVTIGKHSPRSFTEVAGMVLLLSHC